MHQPDQLDLVDNVSLPVEHKFPIVAHVPRTHSVNSETAALDEFFNVDRVHLLDGRPGCLRMCAQIFSFRRQRNRITEHNGNDRDRSHPMAQTPPMTNGCGGFYWRSISPSFPLLPSVQNLASFVSLPLSSHCKTSAAPA